MKSNTKNILGAFVLLIAIAGASSQCLYCRRMDVNAGFLVSYSYCNQTDECLMDAWNYINRDCVDGWSKGSSYGIDYCDSDEIACPSFESDPEKYG